VIAAASREPLEAVHEGRLREDLYDFLSEITLHVPPLRAREDDVVPLAKTFLDTLNRANGTARRLDADAARALAARSWPGNVRELRRAVEQSYACAEGFDAVLRIAGASDNASDDRALRPGASIAAMERKLIELTLAHFHGDKRRAAAVLGVSVRTLYNRLRQYSREAAAD
jgi:DNA-binding NtrC family response regulator